MNRSANEPIGQMIGDLQTLRSFTDAIAVTDTNTIRFKKKNLNRHCHAIF
jgi:hypothetical protein